MCFRMGRLQADNLSVKVPRFVGIASRILLNRQVVEGWNEIRVGLQGPSVVIFRPARRTLSFLQDAQIVVGNFVVGINSSASLYEASAKSSSPLVWASLPFASASSTFLTFFRAQSFRIPTVYSTKPVTRIWIRSIPTMICRFLVLLSDESPLEPTNSGERRGPISSRPDLLGLRRRWANWIPST